MSKQKKSAKGTKEETKKDENLDKYTLAEDQEVPQVEAKEEVEQDESSKNERVGFFAGTRGKVWLILMVVVLLFSVAASAFIYLNVTKESENTNSQPEVSPPVEATPTPKPQVESSDYQILVLNGGGIAGEAGRLKEALTEEGFTVPEVGNAPNQVIYTIVSVKDIVPESLIQDLQTFLLKSYVLAPEIETDNTQDMDIVITIGQELKQ